MLSGIRVLIVEDESLVAATLADAVERAGGEAVGLACTVSQARELIRRRAFEVHPLKTLRAEEVNFEAVREHSRLKLLIATT